MRERIAVVGLGYVGLPVALAFARRLPGTIGFDVDQASVRAPRGGPYRTGEASPDALRTTDLVCTCDRETLRSCSFFVVAVPTPIDEHRRPDLTALERASITVGRALSAGAVVVYESTVYPG